MGSLNSKMNKRDILDIKYKTEKDLPKVERKDIKELLKTNPQLKIISNVPPDQMSPRDWIHTKLGFYYVEPYLTNLSQWSDNSYPCSGSFARDKMDLVRAYLIDNTKVPNSAWDMEYMKEVFEAWNKMSSQFPGNMRKDEKKKRHRFKMLSNLSLMQRIIGRDNQLNDKTDSQNTAMACKTQDVKTSCPSLPPFRPLSFIDIDDDADSDFLHCVFACDDSKQKPAVLTVIPTVIFPTVKHVDKEVENWRKQCCQMWMLNCTRVFEGLERKYGKNKDVVIEEQLKFVEECLRSAFKKILAIFRKGQDVETQGPPFLQAVVKSFEAVVDRYIQQKGVPFELLGPITSKIMNEILSIISRAEALSVHKRIKQQMEEDKEEERLEHEKQKRGLTSQTDKIDTDKKHLNAPLMVFDEKVLEKPLTLAEISRILQDAPKPLTNPKAFINWWTSVLLHGSMSGKDVRYILTTLMPDVKMETLIKACPTINDGNDGPIGTEVGVEAKFPWLSKTHKETHVAEMTEFLKTNASQTKDITQLLNCKRKSDEKVSEYANRFQKCWKEEAKMEIKDTEDPFFVAMFLNGMDPQATYTLKLSAPEVYTLSPTALLKKIRELDAIDLFITNMPTTQMMQTPYEACNNIQAVQTQPQRTRGAGRGYFGPRQYTPQPNRFQYNFSPQRGRSNYPVFNRGWRSRGMRGVNRNVCRICFSPSHWERDCIYKPKEENQDTMQRGYGESQQKIVTAQPDQRRPIDIMYTQ